jgi:hypothetical protein
MVESQSQSNQMVEVNQEYAIIEGRHVDKLFIQIPGNETEIINKRKRKASHTKTTLESDRVTRSLFRRITRSQKQ